VRMNWKKRLSVWSALTLLSFMLMPVLAAQAQITTESFGLTGNIITTLGDTPDQFSYVLDGGAETPFPATGTITLALDISVPHTFVPVPKDGYTAKVDDDIPGIDCTDVTLVVGTPGFCRITFEEIVATTTTTTTTSTTTTTTPVPKTAKHGKHTDLNQCRSHLDPNLNPDADLRIGTTLEGDALSQPHLGKPITLTNMNLGLDIPSSLIQQGIDLDLLGAGTAVPSVATTVVGATNTVESSHTFSTSSSPTVKTAKVPVSAAYPKGLKALPLKVTIGLPSTTWTPTSDSGDVFFSQKSLKIVSRLSLPGIGKVVVTFTCVPSTNGVFVAVGAKGEPGPIPPGPTPSGPGGSGGPTTDPGVGSNELPRTGGTPWPLIVVAAGLIDLGIIAIAASKRRRALH
jgi:hypothetical protein